MATIEQRLGDLAPRRHFTTDEEGNKRTIGFGFLGGSVGYRQDCGLTETQWQYVTLAMMGVSNRRGARLMGLPQRDYDKQLRLISGPLATPERSAGILGNLIQRSLVTITQHAPVEHFPIQGTYAIPALAGIASGYTNDELVTVVGPRMGNRRIIPDAIGPIKDTIRYTLSDINRMSRISPAQERPLLAAAALLTEVVKPVDLLPLPGGYGGNMGTRPAGY